MTSRIERRAAAIKRMADHVLSEGLAGATLRPLAAAAGTSDRMLLYYFADRDELLTAVLEKIATRLLGELENAIPIEPPRPFVVLVEQVWAALGSERLKPYMNIWLDLASGAAREVQPYRDVAGAIADGYLAWVARRLQPQDDSAPPLSAALVLAAIQGMYLLTAIGRPAIAQSAMIELSASHGEDRQH
jgi:AcrR family transcriptional regulator